MGSTSLIYIYFSTIYSSEETNTTAAAVVAGRDMVVMDASAPTT